MTPNLIHAAEESLPTSMMFVVRVFHPNIRAQMTSLKQNFARLVLKGGPQQHEWIFIYKLFYQLSTSLDNHMFHEETSFFPELGALEKRNGKSSTVGVVGSLQQMEEEHRVILRQWKSLEESIKRCEGTPMDEEMIQDTRFELARLEEAIAEHEDFESKMIYRRAKNLG